MAEEKQFEMKVKRYLNERGCWVVKYFGNGYTPSGIPDLLACVNGYFVAIEVKASTGHPSDLQLYNRKKIREAGGISLVLYPHQFDDFKLLIDDLIERPQRLDWNDQKHFDKEGE